MTTEILVENISTEARDGKQLFVMTSKVIAGSVTIGMNMSLPFSSGLDITIPVDEIEIIDAQTIKIKVQCTDSDEVDFLSGLNLSDETLTSEE